jgi:hypothetical protein
MLAWDAPLYNGVRVKNTVISTIPSPTWERGKAVELGVE